MESITFHCKVLTPMFLAGADGRTPELRAPSIKGAMRFWWRALHGHLELESEIKKEDKKTILVSAGLRDREISIFGGTGGTEGERKSSFSMVVLPGDIQLGEEKLVPHKERTFTPRCILPESTFQVKLIIPEDYSVRTKVHGTETEIFNRSKLIALFQVFAALGGIGKRVRRGMGSFEIVSSSYSKPNFAIPALNDLVEVHQLLSTISSYFVLNKEKKIIYHQYSGRMEKYPWIQKIEIGKNHRGFLQKLSQLTHDFKQKYAQKYEVNMGHAFRGRFASPVYVSVLSKEKIVVTTLNTIPNRDNHLIDLNLQAEFKERIL